MALTASNMLALGTKAPDFTLPDVISGKTVSLQQLQSPVATVICFICNHCPFVQHILNELLVIAQKYQQKKINFIAISSNDAQEYPLDSPQKMQEEAQRLNFPFPYLYDETQRVAKDYQAACTPDFFIFDKNLLCVYRGQFDDSRPKNDIPVTGHDLSKALDALLNDEIIPPTQKPSMGCNIKWKK